MRKSLDFISVVTGILKLNKDKEENKKMAVEVARGIRPDSKRNG